MTKKCSKCKIEKDISEFFKRMEYQGGGVRSWCKTCHYKGNGKNRLKNSLKKYNLTLEEYNSLLLSQDNKCYGCFSEKGDKDGSRLCIDHDHKTGKVRGLLCGNCNQVLGHCHDDVEILSRLVIYLKYHKEKGVK